MPPAVLLLSGGLDSYTAGAIAKRRRLRAACAHGSLRPEPRPRDRGGAAVARRARRRAARRARRSTCAASRDSALTGDSDVPKDRPIDAGRHSGHLRAGAQHRSSCRWRSAGPKTLGATDIVIGVNALDYSGYPDCRPEYIRAFETLASLATRAGVDRARGSRVHTPLIALSKAEIIRRGLALGLDYGLTHSCYDPAADGRPCGHCDSCLLRAKGFAEAGLPTPRCSAAADAAHRSRPPCQRPHLLHRRHLPRLHRHRRRTRWDDGGRVAGHPRRDGLLSHDRRPAARHRHARPAYACSTSSTTSRDAWCTSRTGRSRSAPRATALIDAARRLDHMQQHTGQHVLSAAFERAATASGPRAFISARRPRPSTWHAR